MASSPFPPSFPWPFSLPALLDFALHDPFVQTLVNSSANCFFAPYEAGGKKVVGVRRDGKGGWAMLPLEWTTWFEKVEEEGEEARQRVLEELSRAEGTDFPPSLTAFLTSCRTLSLDRTCSPRPVLSFPPACSPFPSSPPPPWPAPPSTDSEPKLQRVKKRGEKGPNTRNAMRSGKSPKKDHEVGMLSRLVMDLKEERRLTHCIDVGSGRAHLSRSLACPPLNLHVLAIDYSASQKSGAELLDAIRAKALLGPTEGSLTHEVETLDAEGVGRAMGRWPPRRGEEGDGGDEEEAEPALLVALHACGDLTPDAIEAFIAADDAVNVGGEEARPRRESQRRRRAIFVGCCYNLMTPSLFPLSSTLSSLLSSASLPPSPLTRAHLRLTPQSPLTWHLTPLSTSSFLSSTLKIAFRARFEAELEAAGVGTEDERRVGRIPECKEWEGYREKARGRYEYAEAEGREGLTEGECEALGFEGEEVGRWERALWRLRVFWTLRSWVGPAVESLCVVDRFAYLVEGLAPSLQESGEGGSPSRRVEVVNVFEQATGSLRNLALVVR